MHWRLIYSPALRGSWNMAIDEAILLAHSFNLSPPTLRLYKWQPPAVSLGLLQPYERINEEACRKLGFEIVRRPSGGQAVLHQHEITYSVVMDGRLCPLGSSVIATYRWLSEGIIAGLKKLGVNASLPNEYQTLPKSPVNFCFVRLTNADLLVNGRKLGGSAQARRRNFLLQHGSIPLRLERENLTLIFGDVDFEQFLCIDWATGRTVSEEEFADALVFGFERTFGITFSIGGLTDEELKIATLLFESKYGTESWTKERKTKSEIASQIKAILKDSNKQS